MRIQHTLCIFLFFFIAPHIVKSCSCIEKNKKKLVKLHDKEITDNAKIDEMMYKNLSDVIKIKSENRSFLIKLEETIKNCAFYDSNSMCSEYQFFNDAESDFMDIRFDCRKFGIVTFFHTTTTEKNKQCTIRNFASSALINSIPTKRTTKVTHFVDKLNREKIENKMCLINIHRGSSFHAMALEVRKTGFYIYHSWENYFSNSWFSGLTNENEFEWSPQTQNILYEYRNRYGLGKCLTKKDLENCLRDMRQIFNVLEGDADKEKKMSFQYVCKELNEDFKKLTD